jgi:hypothetical protein
VLEPVVLEPVVLEPVVLEPVALVSRSRSRGALVSVELGRRAELSVALRPEARRFDFIAPCLLQSHLHSLSLPIVSEDEATLRSDVVACDEVDIDPRSDVLLPVVELPGIVLSGGEAVSFFGDMVVELGRSSVVCASTAGAARASARIEVAASFIGASVRVAMLTDHGGDDLPEGQRTTPRQGPWAHERSGAPQQHRSARLAAAGQAEKLDPHPQVCLAFGFLNENPLCPNCPST